MSTHLHPRRLLPTILAGGLVTILWLLSQTSTSLAAESTTEGIGTPLLSPVSITAGRATPVVVEVAITNPDVIPGSVQFLRLDTSGKVTGKIGKMHDDGQSGDARANDGVFTLQVTLNEATPGAVSLQVSAAVAGSLLRAVSDVVTLTVGP